MNAPVELSAQADHIAWAIEALDAMLARVMLHAAPPPELSYIDWVETYRVLSKEESNDHAGKFSLEQTPVLRGILAAIGQAGVTRVVVKKSAQIGYTAGVVCTVIGYHVHYDPCVIVAMFPREQSAKDFDAEKFSPMVRATPELADRIKLKSRSDGNSATRKAFPGGRLKLVASKSPSDVKSTTARIIIIEEPDDTDANVRGQGDSIALLRNRKKTVRDSLELIGGSPTAKGVSKIGKEMRTTDQRVFMVPCHHCGDEHALDWSNVHIPGFQLSDEDLALPADELEAKWPKRDVYGRAKWEDAFYACPHCGGIWSDLERVDNIRRAARVAPHYGWVPTAQSTIPGFNCSELQSVFEGSYIPALAERFLVADHEMQQGQPEKMIDFWNGTLGLEWEYRGELPEEDELRQRARKYAEWTCPAGAVIALMTVDVQHDRLAVTVWCIGRGEEMWLAYWGEHYGETIVSGQGAWLELEQLLERRVRHASGAGMRIAAVGIDCGDGQTSDASYAFVRKHHRRERPVLALKGASDKVGKVEIWTRPKPIEPNRKATKASRAGIQIHQVGTAKAKDLILGWAQNAGRIRLEGDGAGRMHWYEGVRDDFYPGMLSEIKVPGRYDKNVREWHPLTDRRNEPLDCTVYAVYLCRHLRLHLKKPNDWDNMERQLRQAPLLLEDEGPFTVPAAQPAALPTAAAVHTSAPSAAPAAPAPAASRPPPRPIAPMRRPSIASDDWSKRL